MRFALERESTLLAAVPILQTPQHPGQRLSFHYCHFLATRVRVACQERCPRKRPFQRWKPSTHVARRSSSSPCRCCLNTHRTSWPGCSGTLGVVCKSEGSAVESALSASFCSGLQSGCRHRSRPHPRLTGIARTRRSPRCSPMHFNCSR